MVAGEVAWNAVFVQGAGFWKIAASWMKAGCLLIDTPMFVEKVGRMAWHNAMWERAEAGLAGGRKCGTVV